MPMPSAVCAIAPIVYAEQRVLAVDENEIVPAGLGNARDIDRAHRAHVHAERDLAGLEKLLERIRCR